MIRERFGRAIVTHRLLFLALIAALTAMSGAGVATTVLRDGLPVDFTPQAIFIDKGPMIERLREIESAFGRRVGTTSRPLAKCCSAA